MTGLDGPFNQLTNAATFPAWVAVIAVAVFGTLFIAAMLRADRTPANAALAALTFVGLAVLAAIGLRSGPDPQPDRSERVTPVSFAGVPALACIDDMAGEATLAACENALFNAPETVAAAVAYTAARINRLVALSASPQGNRVATPDEQALRNSIEHDRYGLVAYVLSTRDKCQPAQCAAFAAMSDHRQVSSNMEALIYEGLVARYAPSWSANGGTAAPLVPSAVGTPMATGKPSTIDYPTAASIPPVSIMTEPTASRSAVQADQPTDLASPSAASGGPYVPAKQGAAPKRQAAPKRTPAAPESQAGPVQIVPPRPAE